MPRKFTDILDELLTSESEIARLADLDTKTVKALKKGGKHRSRQSTKRALLAATNQLLEKAGKKAVGPEIFA